MKPARPPTAAPASSPPACASLGNIRGNCCIPPGGTATCKLRAVPHLIAADINAFHVVGGLLALWALLVSALGVLREDFPGKGAGQTVVMAISGLLVVGAIATAIGTAKDEPKGGEEAGKVTKAGAEGTSQDQQSGTAAPGTGANGGQQSGGQGQSAPPGGTVKPLTISADPSGQLQFDKSSLSAPAGNVRITMNNP